MVCFTTRGPENESSAPGSAMITSPSAAKLAATPPVVGWTRTDTNGRPASRSSSTAATVFAICMSARTPSCMRAPPEADTETSGRRCSTARSAARANFSPTTDPMLPPRNEKSRTTMAAAVPPISHEPAIAASRRPVVRSAARSRSGYGFESTNSSGSIEIRSRAISLHEPSSVSWTIRSRAVTGKW